MSFKRPAHITTISPMRSSDRRKLVAAVAEQYGLSADKAKELVPDGLQSARFHTHLDTPGVLYFSASPATANPLWLSLLTSKQSSGAIPLLHPTVYTLLAHPALIETVTTHPHVISRLISGSDLMLPGLAGPPSSADLRPGDMIGIKATGSDEILGVGRCAVASADMKRSRKGKAVEMIHCWKDSLWEVGKDQRPISFSLPKEGENGEFLSSSDDDDDEAEAVGAQLTKTKLDNPRPTPEAQPSAPPVAEVQTLLPQEVETVLRLALLQYLTTLLPAPAPGLFPIPSSTFYERHILPFRPSWAPSQAAVIQKTSYKKVGKWLKAMEKEGLVKLKSGKDQDSVVSADLKHAAVQGHKPHVTTAESLLKDKKKAAREAAASGTVASGSADASKDGVPPAVKRAKVKAIREVFKPSGSTLPFWAALSVSPDTMLTAQDVRNHLQAYITAHTTIPRDQSIVYLDDLLKKAVLSKNEDGMIRIQKADLEKRLRGKMIEFFAIDRVDEEGAMKKGTPASVHIAGKKRASKHVTLVTGLETFGIDPKSFADDLKRLCASSTGVSPLTSASPKAMLSEVLVQGTHDKIVADLLVNEHGIPRKWIVVDKGR